MCSGVEDPGGRWPPGGLSRLGQCDALPGSCGKVGEEAPGETSGRRGCVEFQRERL